MKWAVVALCLLGSVAAASAALLVHALRTPNGVATPTGTADVTVIIAKRTLPAMTVIDSSVVEVQTLSPDKAPANYISSPVSVVGKVLNRPIVEGQAFTTACFAELISAQQLAGVIPSGKRAVGISVTNYAGMNGLLYPGSMVDVMVSMKPGDGNEGTRREAFTTTLLENIQVLAIEQQSVISQNKIANPVDAGRANESHCVTLLVDSKQAKALQLAMEQGTLSLALRNPLDAADADRDAFYAQSLMGNGVQRGNQGSRPTVEIPAAALRWETIIMRGDAIETKSFPMPDGQ